MQYDLYQCQSPSVCLAAYDSCVGGTSLLTSDTVTIEKIEVTTAFDVHHMLVTNAVNWRES